MSEERGEVRARPAAWEIAHKYVSEEGLIDSLAVEINGILDQLAEARGEGERYKAALREIADYPAIEYDEVDVYELKRVAARALGGE